MPTLSTYEKAGIPSVFIIYGDQEGCWRQAAKVNGIPGIRSVHASRTVPGVPDVERMVPLLMDALTRPLTEEEKQKGQWELLDKRVLFEGTLEEAEKFYEQVEFVPTLGASNAIYGDGLPVRVPTEERVAEMLKGTSHKPDEIIRFQRDHRLGDRSVQMGNSGKKGDPVHFLPMKRTATVEKIAIIGVMSGCKPEHMPVLLAMAESGGGCGDGRGSGGFIISGPYAREIDMNFDVNILGPGNVSNRSLGRASQLMWRNLGGNIPTVTNCGVWGGGIQNVIAENAKALPPGWEGLNEECDFNKNDSILVMGGVGGGGGRVQFSPGGYRALQKSGHGGMARRLGVKGKPGPHNWLEYITPGLWTSAEGGIGIYMFPEMAQQLYDYGFKSKEQIYEFIYKKSYVSVGDYRLHSWPDMRTNAWLGIERTSGKHWKELPDDYMIPAMNDPWENVVIVTGNGEEQMMLGAGRSGGAEGAYSIDVWR